MTDLMMCTEHDSEAFNTWLLPIGKVSKLTGHDPKEMCFAKAGGNLLETFLFHPLNKFFWYSLKEKICTNFQKLH